MADGRAYRWAGTPRPIRPEAATRPPGTVADAMTRLLLVRHGESIWNADGRWQGQADPPLSDRGRQQAGEAAARHRHRRRHRHLRPGAGRRHRRDHRPDPRASSRVVVEPRLRERDAGSLSGPHPARDPRSSSPGLLPDDPAGFVARRRRRSPRWPHDWESDDDLWERVEVALVALGRLVPDGDVVVVTHGGVMYAIERRLGAPDRGRLSNLGAVWIEVERRRRSRRPPPGPHRPGRRRRPSRPTGSERAADGGHGHPQREAPQDRAGPDGRRPPRGADPGPVSKAEERRLVEVFRRRYERAGTLGRARPDRPGEEAGQAARPARAHRDPLGLEPGPPLGLVHAVHRRDPHLGPHGRVPALGGRPRDRPRAGPPGGAAPRPRVPGAGRPLPAGRAGRGLPARQDRRRRARCRRPRPTTRSPSRDRRSGDEPASCRATAACSAEAGGVRRPAGRRRWAGRWRRRSP